jgi:hypothetical protein
VAGDGSAAAAAEVGEGEVAQAFYAGRYAEILEGTVDRGAIAPADVAFVVGALTFVDRVDEARAVFDGWRARAGAAPEPRTLAAARFFLGLAAARAGYFDRSLELLVTTGLALRHAPDPWVRAIVFQGLACQWYFTGRFAGAARNALRAIQAAHQAGFPYLAMLGTDMRGHALVQVGQLRRGIAMLEQADRQARRLGLGNNAFSLETSIATYESRFDPHAEVLERIEGLLRRRAHDSYSRRALHTEAAVQRALRGQRRGATEALEAADRDALSGDTRRGKVVSCLARLWVTRFERGVGACDALLGQARALIEPRDVAFRAELDGFEILVARARGDRARERRALASLRALARTSQHFMARAALIQFDDEHRAAAFEEDALAPILRAVAQRDVGALSRVVNLGLLGLVPELLGLAPGRRIILVPSEDLLLLEDHGEVEVRHRPPAWCPALLRILASGDGSKRKIVEGLWGLRTYHPELHDPPVRTTIHRLRAFLRPHGGWISVAGDGYQTAVPVHVVAGVERSIPERVPLWDEGEVPPPPRLLPAASPRGEVDADPATLVLRRLEEVEQASVPELARALELSASTVLRALRGLVTARRVERIGFARATRYRPRQPNG